MGNVRLVYVVLIKNPVTFLFISVLLLAEVLVNLPQLSRFLSSCFSLIWPSGRRPRSPTFVVFQAISRTHVSIDNRVTAHWWCEAVLHEGVPPSRGPKVGGFWHGFHLLVVQRSRRTGYASDARRTVRLLCLRIESFLSATCENLRSADGGTGGTAVLCWSWGQD